MKIRIFMTLVSITALTLSGAELRTVERARTVTRELAQQPVARYQAGSLFSRDSSLSTLWIENIAENGGITEKTLTLPDSFRVTIADVAVSFDGRVAASASATDREGRLSTFIAWLRPDGSLLRLVRTTPFGAGKISFTADGSLWASGIVKDETLRDEVPVHDVLRRYGPDGVLLGTFLPRSAISSERRHPSHDGLLVTSRERIAFVSQSARKWVVLAPDGTILGQGQLSAPENFRIFVAAITDSGRLFLAGSWRGGKIPATGNYPAVPLFEVAPKTGELLLVDASAALQRGAVGHLMGSEGEQLVFHVNSGDAGRRLVWTRVD